MTLVTMDMPGENMLPSSLSCPHIDVGNISSQVYSADMFYTVFKKDPMNGTEGRRYRHTVLERGGSQDEMKTLIDFLGRKPSTEPFYRELGLSM